MPQTTAPRRVWVPFGRSAKDVPAGLVADVFTGVDIEAPGGIPGA